jgi:hypothetical protein
MFEFYGGVESRHRSAAASAICCRPGSAEAVPPATAGRALGLAQPESNHGMKSLNSVIAGLGFQAVACPRERRARGARAHLVRPRLIGEQHDDIA